MRIGHLTVAHKATDNRILDKEAVALSRSGYDVCVLGPHGKRETVDGVHIVPLAVPRALSLRFPWLVTGLVGRCLREGVDVWHFHDPELIPSGILLKILGKRVVYDVHEDYEQTALSARWIPALLRRWASRVWGLFERLSARSFDAIVAVDSHIRGKFPVEKTVLVTNVPPRSFAREAPRPERSGEFRLCYVGAMHPRRGIFATLDALDLVKTPNIKLHVIGDTVTAEFEERLRTRREVVLHGRVPWKKVRELMDACDAGLMVFMPTPAHLLFTGEGNTKLFEFMGLGLPVIYSSLPKLSAFLDGLEIGSSVDPMSAESIAEAIDRLASDGALYRRLSENGRRLVHERFNWEEESKSLVNLYRRFEERSRADR